MTSSSSFTLPRQSKSGIHRGLMFLAIRARVEAVMSTIVAGLIGAVLGACVALVFSRERAKMRILRKCREPGGYFPQGGPAEQELCEELEKEGFITITKGGNCLYGKT